MRILSLFLVGVFLPFFALANQAPQKPYKVLANPLAMTITQTLVSPKEDEATRGKLVVFPDRPKVFLFEKESDLHFTYQLQKNKKAPLVFVIPGTGGTSEASGALFLAEKLYSLGYHTVTMDDAFSWTFAVSGSRSGLPGYTPRDAEDLYGALQKVSQKLSEEKKLEPETFSLVGYSLGGLQSVFMHRLDQTEKAFNFRRVLVIDPPLDLMHAVKSLDHLYDLGNKLGRGRKITVFNRVAEVGGRYMNEDADFTDPALLQEAFNELNFDEKDLAYLIGGSFRDSLRDVIFASQQVNDLKILKSPVSRYKRNQRYDESSQYSFMQYMNSFVYPNVRQQKGPDYTIEDLNKEVSFYQFGKHVQTHKNIFMVHTADDFILKAGDIAWIQDKFQNRAVIFPFGGHCGAMNFPQFSEYLAEVF
ncbi:hypothetical protein [Bdellovibrio sp. HCB337]|uniref:hypothetical protein n=1 Tax=Bdellovibrio sp. HCB337 TaxID=3394358 RepID=UPI0039A56A54